MYWINFLHLYQPANQQKDILAAVVKQSYLPIFKKLSALNNINLSMNITGSLLELFERDNYKELLDIIKKLVRDGKLELTGSCKYHAFIPLIPETEISRQIDLNTQTLQRILGFAYKPKGFFPPEMGYHPKIAPILEKMGFEWLLLDEIAGMNSNDFPKSDKLYKLKNTNLKVFFRNRRVSNLIMSAVARDVATLTKSLEEDNTRPYLFTAMDGETFGHHRTGFENFLFEVLASSAFKTTSVAKFLSSDVLETLTTQIVDPKPSTWSSSIDDIEKGIQFLSWSDPSNPIHTIQKKFFTFTLDLVYSYPENNSNYQEVRHKMDIAMASDHYWWASAKPWWSLEMIEDGAYRLLDVVRSMKTVHEKTLHEAYEYYTSIVSLASQWQREGKVREMALQQNKIMRIPFKERTLGKGGEEEAVYFAFIDLMKNQEKVASENGHYEKAILWRDAVYKIEHAYDIYDTINVIDLLRIEIGNGLVEKTIEKYKSEYIKLRGGQPEQRGN